MRRAVFDAKTRLLMRPTRAALRDMLAAERVAPEQARRRTDERSAAIAVHAYRCTPYYRETYRAAGFTERDLHQPENFARLPLLTKDAIRDAGESLIATGFDAKRRLASRTGGSTGTPLLVYNDAKAPTAAYWWRIYSWWGIQPWDNAAFIYRQSRKGVQKLRYDLEWWPTRHLLLDARGTTDSAVREFDRTWARTRPRLLVGYVEGVVSFAEHVRHADGPFHPPSAISVTASMIHPGQRRFLEDALNAPVYDTYRTAEIPWIAAECRARSGMHVLSDQRRVDIVDESGDAVPPGTQGNVVVTDLSNQVFPLIRYALGDRSHRIGGLCSCGRTLDRIGSISGRIADALRTPSGRIVSGGLGGLFNKWPGIVRQFQVHQAADYAVTIRYVADDERSETAAAEVTELVRGFLGDEVPVRAQRVDSVAAEGGKARLVLSEVAPVSPPGTDMSEVRGQLPEPSGL